MILGRRDTNTYATAILPPPTRLFMGTPLRDLFRRKDAVFRLQPDQVNRGFISSKRPAYTVRFASTGAMNCAPTGRMRAIQWTGHGRSTLRPYGKRYRPLDRLGDPGAPPHRESSKARREASPHTHQRRGVPAERPKPAGTDPRSARIGKWRKSGRACLSDRRERVLARPEFADTQCTIQHASAREPRGNSAPTP